MHLYRRFQAVIIDWRFRDDPSLNYSVSDWNTVNYFMKIFLDKKDIDLSISCISWWVNVTFIGANRSIDAAEKALISDAFRVQFETFAM